MKVLKADFRSPGGPADFVESCQNTGFAVVTNHPISEKLIEEVYQDWIRFFGSELKHRYQFDQKTQSGYFPFRSENAKGSPKKDLKEFYHFYADKSLPPELGDKTQILRDQLLDLGFKLLSWLDERSPEKIRNQFSMPLAKMAKGSSKNLFRIIHYPPLSGKEEEGAIRAAAHEDINLITLLPASTAMGLQVLDLHGNWHDVPGSFGDIVVNVGDMLQMASQNFYRSTTHRVVNPSGEEASKPRYSMPLFVHPHPEVALSESHTADSYLKERLREIGLAS